MIADEINRIRERLRTFNNGTPANDCWKLAFLQEEGEDILLNPDESFRSVAFASMTAEISRSLSEKINFPKENSKPKTGSPASMFKIVRVSDVFDEMETAADRWKSEKRVGRVSYSEEFKTICFHFDETSKNDRYWFYLSQMPTPETQMQWLNHLRSKGWFNGAYFNDFMEVLKLLGLIKKGLS